MKKIQELKEMQEQKNQLFDEIDKSIELDDFQRKEQRVIAGHWVDFIDELLDYNFSEFMDKHGYTEDDIGTTFTSEQPEVAKEMYIREEQARKELEYRENYCKEHPYGNCYHPFSGGIFIEKLERDILKWMLEIE